MTGPLTAVGPGQYLLGLALAALGARTVVAGALGRYARRLLPDWSGAPARLAEAVVFLALVWAVAQLLGVVGLLERRAARARAGAGRGGGGGWAARRGAASAAGRAAAGAGARPARRGGRGGRPPRSCSPSGAFRWWRCSASGMTSSDTLSYHGPVAARFFQEGSITSLEFVYSDPIIPFLPFNSELLHAVGMLLSGATWPPRSSTSGWLGLALLAAWCVGRPYGLGPASLRPPVRSWPRPRS